MCEGGRACSREDPACQAPGPAHARLPGVHASWVGSSVLAMARPWQDNLVKHDVIGKFQEAGIGMIINLCEVGGAGAGAALHHAGIHTQRTGTAGRPAAACASAPAPTHPLPSTPARPATLPPPPPPNPCRGCMVQVGEHSGCGPGLIPSSGFTYSPDSFMGARIGFCNFSWRDMGVPTLDKMMDIVQASAGRQLPHLPACIRACLPPPCPIPRLDPRGSPPPIFPARGHAGS